MPHFVCRLLPPRPSFPFDMTDAERALMGEHVGYWTALASTGRAVLFGPVADPAGVWGLGVVEAPDVAAAQEIARRDPVSRPDAGFRYDVLPMLTATIGRAAAGP